MSTINPTLHIPYYTSDAPVVRYTGSIDSGVVYTDTNNNIQGGKLTFTDDYFNIVNGNSNRISIVCFDKKSKVFNQFDFPTSSMEPIANGSLELELHSASGKYSTPDAITLNNYQFRINNLQYNSEDNIITSFDILIGNTSVDTISNYVNKSFITFIYNNDNIILTCDFNIDNNVPLSVEIILYSQNLINKPTLFSLQCKPITTTNTYEYSWINMDNINASNYVTKSFNSLELNNNLSDDIKLTSTCNPIIIAGGNTDNVNSIYITDNTLNYTANRKFMAIIDIDVIYDNVTYVSDIIKNNKYLFIIFNTPTQCSIDISGGTNGSVSSPTDFVNFSENITTTTSKVFHVSKVITDLYFINQNHFFISIFMLNNSIYNYINGSTNDTLKEAFNSYGNYNFLNDDNSNNTDIQLVGSVTFVEYMK